MKLNSILAAAILWAGVCPGQQAGAADARRLALTPPMGWNDWAHYQCDYTAATILANARALVRSGLAARGYDTVTIDDCWMRKTRNGRGDLQPDPRRFPHGMRPVAAAIHALGLRFGIYEDAGYETCGGFAGSGMAAAGGEPHFLADARRFAAWGVDYLKLDGCNVRAAKGETQDGAYRAAYRAESLALERVGRPVVFSESAPAYFQGTANWYDVLAWVRGYGQLWREGTDVETYDRRQPNRSRFGSVMWNYDYNLPLGRFQRPGNWNDADFIIGGDPGMTLAETRSQLALWSMMSAPLILSSNLDRLSPAAIGILGNRAVLSVDQDPAGRMASLLRRSPSMDLLLKPLHDGSYAVAVLNRSPAALRVAVLPRELGFAGRRCAWAVHDLWTGARDASAAVLRADISGHDTAIWTIRPGADCRLPARIGAITRIVPDLPDSRRDAVDYTRCLAAPGVVEPCAGTPAESWRIVPDGTLRAGPQCLAQTGRRATLAKCRSAGAQRWRYTLSGQLINEASGLCLTGPETGTLAVRACGHNPAAQIWTLPGGVIAR
jgi:alpha-galactosidase